MLKKKLTDRYRLSRAVLVGTVITLLFMPILATNEATTIAVASALAVDFCIFIKQSWLIDVNNTRDIFQQFDAK